MTALLSPPSRTRRSAGRVVRYVILAVLVVVSYLLVRAALDQDPRGCRDEAHRVLPDYQLLAAAAGALLVGRVLGYLRYDRAWAGWRQHRVTELSGSVALVVLFAAVTGVLIYEAVGVDLATGYQSASLEPITYYVRCAIYDDRTGSSGGLLTLAVLILTCGLVGHWLWPWQPSEAHDRHDPPRS